MTAYQLGGGLGWSTSKHQEGPSASPFRDEAETALVRFRAMRSEIERQVRQGDLTVKSAREQMSAVALGVRKQLERKAEQYRPPTRPFLDRLVEAAEQRAVRLQNQSLESLQRETNRLLRLSLVEQQLSARSAEFEARAFTRSMAGGPPVPTVDGLLGFAGAAQRAGDDAALEWSRRQLESVRPLARDEAEVRRIDAACDRPDRINVRIVDRYVESFEGRDPAEKAEFVDHALAQGDANACVAAFVMARNDPEGAGGRLARKVLSSLASYPDVSIDALRSAEAEAQAVELDAARQHAGHALSVVDAESTLEGLVNPSDDEIRRLQRYNSLPIARPGEPIGLAPTRRIAPVELDRAPLEGPAEGADVDEFDPAEAGQG